ncbi:MAG TPA: NAD+ synthase [Candidatus Methylomirabilis sp.]
MLRIAIAQFRPHKAEYRRNLELVAGIFRRLAASASPPDVLVFPEAALTGYFLEGGVQEVALSAEHLFGDLARLHREAGARPLEVVVGFYEIWRTRLHNSVMVAALGGEDAGIRHLHRKVFLPTYGVFDEERFVEPGLSVEAFNLRWGRAAAIVCEDAWHSLMPTIAALDGAQVLFIPSASPARGIGPDPDGDGRPGSVRRWERTVQAIAAEHGFYIVLAQLAGFEGGKALSGGSCVVGPRGEILIRGPLFEEALLEVEVDLEEIVRARAETPLLSDLEMRLPHLVESLAQRRVRATAVVEPAPVPRPRPVRAPQRARAEDAADPLLIDPELTRKWLVEFIRDEVTRRRGFEHAVVGLSGGVDSALVLFLAAEALGPPNVWAIRMPYHASSPESLAHAQLVIDATGVHQETVDISAAVDGLAKALPEPPDPPRIGNICARTRMITLFDRSAGLQALPLGTGNKSERLFGYFTWHADDSPPVNPLGDLFKTQVWALARHVGVPDVIVEKPATADLITGQTDEGDFGISYRRADLILHWLLLGHRPEEIALLGFTAEEVQLVRHRLESTHWKRRLPTVAMLSQTAIGEYYLRPVDY